MKSFLLLLVIGICASFALSQTPVTENGDAMEEVHEIELSLENVDPGECHTNNDGVEVCNTGDSGDKEIAMTPKSGKASSKTTVNVKNKAQGTVSGIDGNDTVNVSSGADVQISGTGGTVNVSAGSSGSVTNTAGSGGGSITIQYSGMSFHVPPGFSITFN